MGYGMAALTGEYRKSHSVVAGAAVLATHDGFHADLIGSLALTERSRVTVGTVEPFCVLGVWEPDPGHVSGLLHHYVVQAAFHGALTRKARTRLYQAPG